MEIDVLDPQLYAGDPYPTYAWLRENDPVHRDAKTGIWVLSRYADVVHVSKNPRIFCSGQGVIPGSDNPISIVTMDDPRHTQLRSLVSRGFTPRMVNQLHARVLEITTACLDAICRRGSCDFTRDVAVPLPLLVIAEMIGIRAEDRERFGQWSDAMILAAGQQDNLEIVQGAAMAYLEYSNYLQGVFEDRRAHPRDDLVSILVAAEGDGKLAADGENISADELLLFMTLLLVAGNETTRNAISGGMLALDEWPAERRKLLERPELLPTAVEEILRWVTPVVAFRRTATQDTEIRGQKIREGEQVLMLYQSANRDPAVFEDADSFRVDRQPNEHVAFGIGTHFCLGANLARLEIRVALEQTFRRLPDIRVAPGETAHRIASPLVRAIESLPMVFTPVTGEGSSLSA